MSLHYLVKLEMLIGHVLPLDCYSKKLQNLFTSTMACKFARFKPSWLQHMGVLQEMSAKYESLIWMWNSDWERSGLSWIMSSLQQPFVNGVVDSSRSLGVVHLLLQDFTHAVIN